MSLKSILSPDTSVLVGIANGAIILTFYQKNLPDNASVRVADAHDGDIESQRKMAAWQSAAVLGFTFLLTRDRNAFLIGGLVLAAVDLTVKHANGVNPMTGTLQSDAHETIMPADVANVYNLPDYTDTESAEGM